MSSDDNHCKQTVWIQIRPDILSGLIWIQAFRYWKNFFKNLNFDEKIGWHESKHNYPACMVFTATTVNVLKIRTLVACQKGLVDKQRRPSNRSDWVWISSMIRAFTVCFSDKNFCEFQQGKPSVPDFIWEQKEKSVRTFRTLPYCTSQGFIQTHHKRFYTWYKKTKSSSLLDECRPDGVLLSLLHQHVLVVHVLHRVLEPTLDVRFTCKRAVFINRPLACRPSVQILVHAEQRNFIHQNVPVIDHSLYYSKTCLKQQLKIAQTKGLIANDSLMKVKSIAECSRWSILQYFWPALSNNWSLKPICDIFWVVA